MNTKQELIIAEGWEYLPLRASDQTTREGDVFLLKNRTKVAKQKPKPNHQLFPWNISGGTCQIYRPANPRAMLEALSGSSK